MSAPPAEAPGYRAALRVIKAPQSPAPGGAEVQALARGGLDPPSSVQGQASPLSQRLASNAGGRN